MDTLLPGAIGFLSGLIYNEHIYQQAIRFPKRSLRFSFWARFIPLSLLMLWIGSFFGSKGLLVFLGTTLVGRFLHTVLRAFVTVRY